MPPTQIKKLESPTKAAVAKALAKEIYIGSVRRVIELAEKMPTPPTPVEMKKMLQRRMSISVDAAEVFMTTWPSVKGRFETESD